MTRLRLGQVDYINCLPVYHALEEGLLVDNLELIKGTPARLNKMFLNGELDFTPISTIEYARHSNRCIILPGLSLSADGKTESIFLFSHIPIVEMEGNKVCVTTSAATSVTLLRILFEHYYHVEVEIIPSEPDLDLMLAKSDGALLTGDEAMYALWQVQREKRNLLITDLGEAWKDFTKEKLVYAVWVTHSVMAKDEPKTISRISNLLLESQTIGMSNRNALVEKAHRHTKLPRVMINSCLETIHYALGEEECRALTTFFDFAYKSGLIDERIKLNIWDTNDTETGPGA